MTISNMALYLVLYRVHFLYNHATVLTDWDLCTEDDF